MSKGDGWESRAYKSRHFYQFLGLWDSTRISWGGANTHRSSLVLHTSFKEYMHWVRYRENVTVQHRSDLSDKPNIFQIHKICQHLMVVFLGVNNIDRLFLLSVHSSCWYPLWRMTAQNTRIAQLPRAALPPRRGERYWRSTRYCVLFFNCSTLSGLQVWLPAGRNETRWDWQLKSGKQLEEKLIKWNFITA